MVTKQKQFKCPSIDEYIKKTLCIYAVEYDSIITKNKVLLFVMVDMARNNTET